MYPAMEEYLIARGLVSERQLQRAGELAQLWQGTVPVVLWKLGWIDLNTFAALLEYSV
ncbi:DUF2949 domain-containing protein [Gloeobacter morelensis MG652769]|uniref:DUF2949 domain-containing protein n=2 Tax=Gloeobacter TaxID=33071 RepID=A0ABY3PHS5_9CYAN|nr:DUF2949 domain-containing protein [Gloeobacter morelensis MG652769]